MRASNLHPEMGGPILRWSNRPELKCGRCRHPQSWHRLDDASNVSPTDPKAEFRCIGYDCEVGGPVPKGGRACDCPDYQ